MTAISPIKHRLNLVKESLFGDPEIIWEVLINYRDQLPNSGLQVSWIRDGEFIVGKIEIDGQELYTQGHTAQEFVEMVNDAIYAVYQVPNRYSKQLGGKYRLIPSKLEFDKLNNSAITKSTINFDYSPVTA